MKGVPSRRVHSGVVMRGVREQGSLIHPRKLLLAALPAVALVASGCAYIGAAAALALIGGSAGGSAAGVAQVEPVAILGGVGPRVIGTVQVDYQLQDANADLVDIEVEVSSDGGASFVPATISNPDTGTVSGNVITGVAASGSLASHSFDWDSGTDLGSAAINTVQLRITPTDATGLSGLESVSATFTTGNDAPEVEIAALLTIAAGIFPVELTVYDSTSDACDLQVEFAYSTDGGSTFTPLAPATILFPSPFAVLSVPRPAGQVHTFAWDSVSDVGTLNALARLQATPDDTFDVGLPVMSNDFTVSNNDAPAAFINEVGRQDGIVQVDFILVDPQQDPVDVVFDYTLDATMPPDPLSFSPVTIDSGSTTGLPSDGSTQSVNWNSIADLGMSAVSAVRLRITPSDAGGAGTDYLSPFFVVGNDPPTIVLDPITGTRNEGVITISFTLTDSTADPADLDVRWSTDGGSTFTSPAATIEVGSVTNVAPGPTQQRISWNSIADLGQGDFPTVVVQITPCDDETGLQECGLPDTTGVFRALNVDRPVGFVASPTVGDAVEGTVTVSYLVFDTNSDPLDILMEFSTDDGITFSLATERVGPPSEGTTGLSSRPDGERHDFVWDTDVDLPGLDLPLVRLQVTPSDAQGAGLARAMDGPFLVNNNQEPEAFVGTPPSPQMLGNVDVDYSLQDLESNPVDITVEFSSDGGTTFASATDAGIGAGSDGVSSLSSGALGAAHLFVWDSIADGIALNIPESDVIFRIIPSDNLDPLLGQGPASQTILFTVDNTSPPTVVIGAITSPQTGDMAIDYTLMDAESAPQGLVLQYSMDGFVTFQEATEGAGSDGTSGLASSPGGIAHVFVWETATDLGPAFVMSVEVRITATDTKSGTATSGGFDVDNNDAPVAFVTTPSGTPAGDVVISYTLTDTNGDTTSITAEVSTDSGSTFASATERPGLPSEGLVGLITSPVGVNHIFVWDTIADLGFGSFTNVVFRVTPQDTDLGNPTDSAVFSVSNQTLLPAASIDPVSRSFTSNVTITYRLFDGDSDLSTIAVEFSIDSGTTWSSATDAGGASDGKTGLSASPAGEPHTFIWDSATDVPGGAQSGLLIRITPTDTDGTGTADTSNPFIRGNDVPLLTITAPAPASNQSGLIEVSYDLVDSTSDAVDLIAEYSTDFGTSYNAASISVGETVGLTASAAPGTPHNLAWNSVANLGVGNFTGVLFRLTPRDFPPPDGTPGTVTIDVDNNDLPIAFIGSPSGGDLKGADVPISYILIDGNGDAISIVAEVSMDGGTTFSAATLANTDQGAIAGNQITGLFSSPDGIGHSFDWLSGTDMASTDTDQAQVRITPSDPLNAGNPFTTANFLVNNNTEPEVQAINSFTGDQTGNVPIDYSLVDTDWDTTTIAVTYSTDGGATFNPATLASTDEGTISGNEISGLSTAPTALAHSFDWVSGTDLAGVRETSVVVRIEPRDNGILALGLGPPALTAVFTVDNTTAPVVNNASGVDNSGIVTLSYDLFDAEPPSGPTVDIRIEFQGPSGFVPATISNPDEGTVAGNVIQGQTPLDVSPGEPHSFDWDTLADIGSTDQATVLLRFVPMDTKVGAGVILPLTISNNDPPEVLINSIAGVRSGDVNIPYRLRDSFSDICSITVEYRIGLGAWTAATEGAGSDGTSNLTSGPIGQEPGHLYIWDSISDLSTTIHNDIRIRIAVDDGTVAGSPTASNVFSTDNALYADLVLGFDTFSQSRVDGRGLEPSEGSSALGGPGLAYDWTNLYIADRGGNRILVLYGIPASDFQTADRVVGQPEFSTNVPNYPDFQASTNRNLNSPKGVCSDGTSLYVADTENHRVLVWNSIPTVNYAAADYVLGQPDFASNSANQGGSPASTTLDTPYRVQADATRLYVSDTGNHRVLIYNLPIGANEQPAVNVLGQLFFNQNSPNQGWPTPAADTLRSPQGIFTDGTTLYVADSENHRVLSWIIPGLWGDGDPAGRVLGQSAMNTDLPNNPVIGLDTLNLPGDVYEDGSNVYVADRDNNRILIYNLPVTVDGQAANVVVGQLNGTSSNRETTQEGLAEPTGVVSTGSKLLINEQGNNRHKIHNSIPTTNYEPADVVFGQRNFTDGGANHAEVNARTFKFAAGLDTDGNQLFVADWDSGRVLGWSLLPDVNNKNADIVFGQTSFTDSGGNLGPDRLFGPVSVAYDPSGPGRLFVADSNNNRVVVYTSFGVGATGSAFIGQLDGSSDLAGTSSTELTYPTGVSWDGTRLWVVDAGNHRLLRFTAVGTGAAADMVLGQEDFASGGADHTGSDPVPIGGDQSFNNPLGVVASGNGPGAILAVADSGNHRAMIWNTLPSVDDQAATLVLGQADFTTGLPGATARDRLKSPVAVESKGTALYVIDGANFRMLIWDSIPAPASHGTPADRIIGQPNFQSASPNSGGVSARALFMYTFWNAHPSEVTSGPTTYLWVPDILNNRVLRFDVTP